MHVVANKKNRNNTIFNNKNKKQVAERIGTTTNNIRNFEMYCCATASTRYESNASYIKFFSVYISVK